MTIPNLFKPLLNLQILIFGVIITLNLKLVSSDIKYFSHCLSASSNLIHYFMDYLLEPGYVDLSNVKFSVGNESSNCLSAHKQNMGYLDVFGFPMTKNDDTYTNVGVTTNVTYTHPTQSPHHVNTITSEKDSYDYDLLHFVEDDVLHVNTKHEEEDIRKTRFYQEITPKKKKEHYDENQRQKKAPNNFQHHQSFYRNKNKIENYNRKLLTQNSEKSFSIVDIVLFREPSECSRSKRGCHWPDLGIGIDQIKDNQIITTHHCCNKLLVQDDGYCHLNNKSTPVASGTLLIDSIKFKGEHRTVNIPFESPHLSLETTEHSVFSLLSPKIPICQGSGNYVLLFSNCNIPFNNGRNISVHGPFYWVSNHGYLPGNLFQTWRFYIISSILYLLLLFWYGINMKIYQNSLIGIQVYIIIAILLGLVEMLFKTIDYWYWNDNGYRSLYLIIPWVMVSVLKRAISRCLGVMVCLGWGVIRNTLEQKRKILFLGIFYLVISATHTIIAIFMIKELQTVDTYKDDQSIVQSTHFFSNSFLTFIEAVIDVIFYMWIFDALIGTMQYLSNMNQHNKLQRYLRLRCIFLISLLFSITWAVFTIVNASLDVGILKETSSWAILAAWDVNYLFLLSSIAVLWKPMANANDYAYNMELPSSNMELELSTNVGTIDDNDDDYENDFHSLKCSVDNNNNGDRNYEEIDLKMEYTEHA